MNENSNVSDNLYTDILDKVKGLSAAGSRDALMEILNNVVEEVIGILATANIGAMLNASRSLDKEDYHIAHSLNVCLIAIKMGIKLKYQKRRLKDLALFALDHAEEYIGIPADLLAWVEHDKEIDGIVKLADVYDSLTHPPSYRHELTTADTLMSIIDSQNFFAPDIVKMLMREISLYPIGCMVELNNGEIGEVVETNEKMPLRPVIRILTGRKINIDLSKEGLIRIIRAITKEERSEKGSSFGRI
ncbi:MAG: hypothetical protein P9L88_01930 [Candidatus Tantalella remota]|nr:hypothetical protein [Candidatus Tantalella remota]